MPYKNISSAKDAGFPTKAEGVPMTLAQINKLADIYDALKEQKKVDNPMAVAWTQWKKIYKKIDDKWVKKEGSETAMFYPISIDELKFAEGKNTTEIQVLPIGTWNHPVYGKIKINEEDLESFKKNFEGNVRKELPITEGHPLGEEEKPAIGWFKKIVNKGRSGLWAVVEWTKGGMDLIQNKAYKYFSPEFYTTYEDPETRKKYSNVLVGGALTNRPYFKGLQAVVLSELILSREMTLEDILKKEASELTDEEVTLLKEKEGELTDEQKETFKDVLKEDEEEKKEETEKAEKKEEEKEETDEDEEEEEDDDEKKDASDATVISKKALKFLETKAQEGVNAMAKWRKTEADGYAKELTFSETNPNGKILPKSRDKVAKFLLSLSEKQQKAFRDIMAELPQSNLFSEIGDSSASKKASEQVDKLVQEKMKEGKLEYRPALEQVFAEHPELQEQYSKE